MWGGHRPSHLQLYSQTSSVKRAFDGMISLGHSMDINGRGLDLSKVDPHVTASGKANPFEMETVELFPASNY